MDTKELELLAPAGDFEKLRIAVAYGANALYLSGTSFGLRAKAKNFDSNELSEAIAYAHQYGVKVYVTTNIFAHNEDIEKMTGHFESLASMGADAFIISDPGVLMQARKEVPDVEIHISTQANTTNYASAMFWHEMGASRIILARELSLDEIAEIRAKCPKELKLEAFVHGAMCMSYSGRCLLSRYMSTGDGVRDANLGACTHPCRYSYRLWAEEVSRPGHFMPIEENERGTDIFGAEDLCMVDNIPALVAAGIESFKIEGRMKTAFYVGLTTRTYRQALDSFLNDEDEYNKSIPDYLDKLKMASHRPFSSGFYFGKDSLNNRKFIEASYSRTHDFVGVVKSYDPKTKSALIEQRNVFEVGDILTFIEPSHTIQPDFSQQITKMQDENGINIERAPHAKQKIVIPVDKPVEHMAMICRETEKEVQL
ncbi:MAG: U32 family peptidase [Defluviitaleaceae bacterium]|nr:U32 family peptidase [Defluviitaleaceae bacterium]